MEEFFVDVPVLIIFFNRPEQLSQVFNQVKKARPSKLYLYQDGAREGKKDDAIGVEKCREIVSDENINWNCQVHRFYQEKNQGCDPSEYIAQKWMFKDEEYGIVLEDDDVPSQSFFPYCRELLEKYKNDDRINIICGMNNLDISPRIKSSYFFSRWGSIWGWASWKRVIDTWDGEYLWLDSPEKVEKIRDTMGNKMYCSWEKTVQMHKESKKEHYESILAASMYLYDRVNIVPKYNMISNIGISKESTHSVSDIRLLPRRAQKLLYKKTYEIDFPLVHPTNIGINSYYDKKLENSINNTFGMKVESLIRSFIYLGFNKTIDKIIKRLNKQ